MAEKQRAVIYMRATDSNAQNNVAAKKRDQSHLIKINFLNECEYFFLRLNFGGIF
jgi:hypothetical protein